MMKMLERDESSPSGLERSYILQRKGMAWIGIAIPVVLFLSSLLGRTEFQESISAYYWTRGFERNFFVGGLFAIGAFLYLYKGDSKAENFLLDVAGVLAVGVAFVPTAQSAGVNTSGFPWHGLLAAAFFVFIALYCISMTFLTRPKEARARARREQFLWRYVICTAFIVGAVMTALVFNFVGWPIFWPEAVAVWAFSAFWYFNTRELDPSEPWVPLIWKQGPQTDIAA